MKVKEPVMNRNTVARCLVSLILVGICLAPGWAVSTAYSALAKESAKPAGIASVKGMCTFGGKQNAWSAKLTPKGDGTYDAIYISTWSGKPLNYVGTIKTDLKSEISGSGKASGGGGNGTFEFSGKYGTDGIAQCKYYEVNGRGRKGTMTAEMPK
jgi:hypothetical protein